MLLGVNYSTGAVFNATPVPAAYSQIDYGKVFSAIFQLSNLLG